MVISAAIAAENSVVMMVDIGTYVLPDADIKIFLTASVRQDKEGMKSLLKKALSPKHLKSLSVRWNTGIKTTAAEA